MNYKTLTVKGKTVLLHRYIMELHLGRKLLSSEIIHHKDGDKFHNEVDNLMITDRYEHQALHKILREEKKKYAAEYPYDYEKTEKRVRELALKGWLHSTIAEEVGLSKKWVGAKLRRMGLGFDSPEMRKTRQILGY